MKNILPHKPLKPQNTNNMLLLLLMLFSAAIAKDSDFKANLFLRLLIKVLVVFLSNDLKLCLIANLVDGFEYK